MVVKVPDKEVKRQLDAVRESGEVNMMDMQGVQAVAADRDYYRLVMWIEDKIDKHDWHRVVMEGVKTESEKVADDL